MKYIIRMAKKWKEKLRYEEPIIFNDISEYAMNVEVANIKHFIEVNNFCLEYDFTQGFIKFDNDTVGVIMSTEDEVPYAIKQSQLQRVFGELKALNMLYYDSYGENADFYKMKKMIEKFEEELKNSFG